MPTSSPGQSSPTDSFSVSVRDLSVARADRPVLVDVNVTFSQRSRVAVVGPNGVGKSTLLRAVAGRLAPDRGSVVTAPPTTTIGLLDQELDASGHRTVKDLIASRLGITEADAELAAASAALADHQPGGNAGDRYEAALERYLSLGAADFEPRLDQMAAELNIAPRLLHADPLTLSGGEAERVGLAIVMLSRFDLTLLDEPTNNLDLDGLARLEEWVGRHRGGLILVSHDRAFLERTITTVLEVDHHHHTVSEFNGGWQAYLIERQRAADLARERYADYVEQRDHLSERVQQQREWAAKGASRARKSPADNDKIRRKYQLAQTEKLVGKAKATLRAIDRLEEVDKPWEPWDLRFTIERAPRSAGVVATFDQATLRRGDFALGPIDLEIRWAERVAIVGPNGSGKSTLLEAMLGRLNPESGGVKLGPGVVVGELDQSRDLFGLRPGSAVHPVSDTPPASRTGAGSRVPADGAADRSLVRAFQDASGLAIDQTRSVLAKFGLDAEAVSRSPATLSPGQRTRAQLALFQVTGVNLLVLDEPTNHLDLEAIEQLESALAGFDGTVLLVTHDRRLLENVQLTRTIDLAELTA